MQTVKCGVYTLKHIMSQINRATAFEQINANISECVKCHGAIHIFQDLSDIIIFLGSECSRTTSYAINLSSAHPSVLELTFNTTWIMSTSWHFENLRFDKNVLITAGEKLRIVCVNRFSIRYFVKYSVYFIRIIGINDWTKAEKWPQLKKKKSSVNEFRIWIYRRSKWKNTPSLIIPN